MTDDSFTQALCEFRDRLFRDETNDELPAFLKRPEVQLTDYAARREASPLGRIFQVANGLHPHLDAVVVLGCDESISGIRAITDACCDPYHNELSRADRGSKPRLYFAGNHFDNDATASLLHRLASGGYGHTEAEKRFAIIAIGYPDREAEVLTALPHFIDALRTTLGEQANEWLPRLVVPVCHPQSQLLEMVGGMNLSATLELFPNDNPLWDILSPVSLLPAAFLGLDCMKLLEGAFAITEEFRTADSENNLVLRYAVQQLLDADPSQSRKMKNWSPSLNSLHQWHDLFQPNGAPAKNMRSLEHWSIRSCRTDSIFQRTLSGLENPEYERSLDQLNESAIENVIAQSNDDSSGAGWLMLPEVDTYGIGQWMQLLMLQEHFLRANLRSGEKA